MDECSFYIVLLFFITFIPNLCLAMHKISDYRLITKDRPNAGIVEVFNQEFGWGIICDPTPDLSGWTFELASVVCYQLNFPGTARHLNGLYFNDDDDGWTRAITQNISTYYSNCSTVDGTILQCERSNSECHKNVNFNLRVKAVSCKEPGYLGCFSDDSYSFVFLRDRLFSSDHKVSYSLTIAWCIITCEDDMDKDYLYAGVEFVFQCFCGAQGENIVRDGKADDKECSGVCSGDRLESCGGSNLISIYQLGLGVCEDPGTPVNGFRYNETDLLRYGSKVYFNCSDGYDLQGPDAIQCVQKYRNRSYSPRNSTHDVVWDHDPPTCRPTGFISTLPPFPTTKVRGQTNLIPSTRTYSMTLTNDQKGFSSTSPSHLPPVTANQEEERYQITFTGMADVNHTENQRGIIYISVGIASALIVIVFVIGLVFLCRRRNRREQNLAQDRNCTVTYETIDSGAAYTALKIGSSGAPIIGPENLTFFARLSSIGRGEFGEVWKGDISVNQIHRDVAIRLVSDQVVESGNFPQAIRVLYELTDQLNVVKCLGYCREKGSILYEFVSGGSLLTYLQAKRGQSQPTYNNLKPKRERLTDDDEGRLLNMAWQVAKGMEFLVSQKITHGALCAHNVLLADEKLCKISDYGLSTSLFRDKVKLTRWSCPETMATGGQSTEGDIWSFGIVLWEIVTLGSRPYPKMTFDMVQMKVIDGYQMPRPHHCGQEVYTVMSGCWEKEAGKRSSFDQILKSLETILEKAHNYMSLSNIDDGLYESTLDM